MENKKMALASEPGYYHWNNRVVLITEDEEVNFFYLKHLLKDLLIAHRSASAPLKLLFILYLLMHTVQFLQLFFNGISKRLLQ